MGMGASGTDAGGTAHEKADAAAGIRVTDLYRYPVKGLSPERLDAVDVTERWTFPFDRLYAIENGPGRFDPTAPKHLPKLSFVMRMRNERLGALETSFAPEDHTLTIKRSGKQVARGQLSTPIGRAMIEQFFAGYLEGELRGAPKVVSVEGHSFSDVPVPCVHIINLESLRALEHVVGRTLDPLRFRANIHIDGAPAWAEFDWIGKTLEVGDGVRLTVLDRTVRCAAVNVDPSSGDRDLSIPSVLQRTFGHEDFGIYAEVTSPGRLTEGDALSVG
ncbi:MAG: MOSC domain-containing protein [Pseudomonadota bacterium]